MSEIEKLKKENEELKARIEKIIELPIYQSYLSISVQLENWNKQLQTQKINLFESENKPIFEMAYKYFVEMKPLLELQEYLRSKLTEDEAPKAKQAISALEKALQERGAFKE